MKIAISTSYGGFNLSMEAMQAIARRKGLECYGFSVASLIRNNPELLSDDAEYRAALYYSTNPPDPAHQLHFDRNRTDPDLIAVIGELGGRAGGPFSRLKIVEVPDGIVWEIQDHGGTEWVIEIARTWS